MKRVVLLLCIFVIHNSVLSQIDFGSQIKVLTIDSKVLEQEREVLLYSPNFVNDNKLKYPTIFLLDGRENLLLLRGIVSNLVRADVMPKVNILAINNYDYDRVFDLTPTAKIDENEDFGGAEKFIQFIQEEVKQEISSHIGYSNFDVLIGHSLGGLFGTYVLQHAPDLFDGYLNVGSSYWFDKGVFVDDFLDWNASNETDLKNKNLYFSMSNETDSRAGFEELKSKLNGGNLEVKFENLENSDHVTSLVPSIYSGLQFIFQEWAVWDSLYSDINLESIRAKVGELSVQYDMDVQPRMFELATFARGETRGGNYSEAIEILIYLKEFYPESIMVLNFLGEAYEQRGDLTNARSIYNQSLKIPGRLPHRLHQKSG